MSYMRAAAAYGVATHPMEGFDGRAVAEACGIPRRRYSVPLVVATGYEEPAGRGRRDGGAEAAGEEDSAEDAATHPRSPRFAPHDVFRSDTFERPLHGVPVL
jgi:hypothetical protein